MQQFQNIISNVLDSLSYGLGIDTFKKDEWDIFCNEVEQPRNQPISKEDLIEKETNKELQLELVKEDYNNIKYFSNQFEETQIEAIKQSIDTIRFLKNPTLNVCLEVLNNNPNYIIFMDIQKYPELYEKYYFMKI